MKTKRPIVINNCLVHGICNFNCMTCTVNKDVYKGPREFQKLETFKLLLKRIDEAAAEGIRVRYLALSGDGEPTLHPELEAVLEVADEFLRKWKHAHIAAPEIALVTNGSKLDEKNIFDFLRQKAIGLKISFPTINPEHYGEIMMMDAQKGKELQSVVLANIGKAMHLCAQGEIKSLEIHVAPPYREIIKNDFPQTLEGLTQLAEKNGMRQLNLVLFPSLTNRAGGLRIMTKKVDRYPEFYRKYHQKIYNNVKVYLSLSSGKFYRGLFEFVDLLKSFKYPCIWYGNIFLTASGDSVCCNDQSALEKDGNISEKAIREIMEFKEKRRPVRMCKSCNQSPEKLTGAMYLLFHRMVTQIKMKKNNIK
jgi:hypothetical protein